MACEPVKRYLCVTHARKEHSLNSIYVEGRNLTCGHTTISVMIVLVSAEQLRHAGAFGACVGRKLPSIYVFKTYINVRNSTSKSLIFFA